MLDQHEISREIIAELEAGNLVLPTLPDVALRVTDAADDPDVSLASLAEVIGTDAALAAQLVRVANSPIYRGRFPVDNIQVAVSRLGLKVTKNIVSSLIMEQMFNAPSPALEARLQELWQHSVEVAAISRVLASKHPAISTEEAMLAGLTHAIGVLPILLKADSAPELFVDDAVLRAVIRNLNAPIGVAILESWGFPAGLVEVVAEHENYRRQSLGAPDLVDIVQVATLQSHYSDHGMSEMELADIPSFAKLGMQAEVDVVELEENSEEYAEALALFRR